MTLGPWVDRWQRQPTHNEVFACAVPMPLVRRISPYGREVRRLCACAKEGLEACLARRAVSRSAAAALVLAKQSSCAACCLRHSVLAKQPRWKQPRCYL